MEPVLILLLAVKYKSTDPEDLFENLFQELEEEDPFMSKNDFDYELRDILKGGLIEQKEDGTLALTKEGQKVLDESKILTFIMKVKRSIL